MKMVSTLPSSPSWKRINVPLASFVAGLALATATIVGGGELLGGEDDTAAATFPTQIASRPTGLVMAEPDFTSPADVSSRSVGPVMAEPDFGSLVLDPITFVMDEPDFGSAALDYSAFEVNQDDNLIAVDSHFGTGVESVSAIEGDFLR